MEAEGPEASVRQAFREVSHTPPSQQLFQPALRETPAKVLGDRWGSLRPKPRLPSGSP